MLNLLQEADVNIRAGRASSTLPQQCDVAERRPFWPAIAVDKAIPWVEAKTGLVLAESQKQALALAVASKVLVITGGPGVGRPHW